MKRAILAGFLGLFTWVVVATIINRVLRFTLPGYHAAELTLQFTLTMKFARLLMAAAASLAAGAVARWSAPANSWVAPVVGAIIFALFLPAHLAMWSKFPLWYHLTFLLTIVPLVMLGAKIPPKTSMHPGSPLVQRS